MENLMTIVAPTLKAAPPRAIKNQADPVMVARDELLGELDSFFKATKASDRKTRDSFSAFVIG